MPLDPIEIVGGLAIGEGLGGAIADTVEPRLQSFKNEQWAKHTDKPLEPDAAAEVAAEDVDSYPRMETEASFSGLDAQRFADLYGATLNAPGEGTLLQLLRRNAEVSIDFAHGLRKARLEPQWDAALRNLRDVRIPGPDLAYMVVRGVVPNAGTLPSALPTTADRLALPPQLGIDTLAEASLTGWDPERFAALVARSGLAMAPVMAAQANFRGILTDNDYLLTIARGDLFPAYADPVLEVSRQIPTATEFVEAQVRGQATPAERRAGTALHGMTTAHSDLLYEIAGRGIAPHAITTGLARGGKFPGDYAAVPEPYKSAIERALTRPEFAELAYANRYTYPSAFVLRALAQAGELGGQPEVEQVLLEIGWKPDMALKVSTAWTGGAKVADPHVGKAQTQLWTKTHTGYVRGIIDQPTATTALGTAGVTAAAIPAVLTIWDAEAALHRTGLTAAQIKKAYAKADVNAATGVAWTLNDALDALHELGYSPVDAQSYLNIG